MSQENVEIVRRIYGWLNRGDFKGPGGRRLVRELFDPDVELQQLEDVVGTAGTFRGYEGLVKARDELTDALVDMQWHPEQHFELGDSVAFAVRAVGTGRASGVRSDVLVGHLWVLRAGRVLRWVVYANFDEALKAAGLSA